jgi:hypothetical protein
MDSDSARITVQSILREHYPAFERCHRLPQHVRDAVHSIIACRTAVLGGHIQACPDEHFERHWYNSCHHRACPQCAYLQTTRWLEEQKARLLSCEHYHAIFTIHHDLNVLWLLNVRVMIPLLFKTVRETLFGMLQDPRHLGATPGVIMALHTWGQTLILHPHIHCLITGGGWDGEQWKAIENGFLLPAKAVMREFRKRFIQALRRAVEAGELTLPEGCSPQQLHNLLNRVNRVKWNVHIRERYEHGEGVASYLARYLKGGPIGNGRLLADDGEAITFRYLNNHDKDEQGRGKPESLSLPADEFIGRLLMHVPPPGMHTVRAYGLYAGAKRDALERCRAGFGQGCVEIPDTLDWQSLLEELFEAKGEPSPACCPVCGKRLLRTGAIAAARGKPAPQRPGAPPPSQRLPQAA